MPKPPVRTPKKKSNPLKAAGVTVQEQRLIAKAIKNAREMALLPYTSTAR